jgi:hypothetical protein
MLKESFFDDEKGETVNMLTADEAYDALHAEFGEMQVCLYANVEKGEVLIDSRGQGSLQK